MDIEKLIRRLRNDSDAYRNGKTLGRAFADQEDVLDNAATAISTLQAENKRLNKIVCSIPTTPDSGRTVSQYDKEMSMCAYLDDLEAENEKLRAELEQVKRERDAAVDAVKNMAEYIVCAGRVDYFLCDEISQEHHLKYQPKNDGNYDNEPCYKCVADWFLQGHKWQESE